jgi:uncharacterized protein (DUF2141 family)
MKKIILLTMLIFLTLSLKASERGTLKIEVNNITEKKGFIMVTVYNSSSSFMEEDEMFVGKEFKVTKTGTMLIEIELPFGDYALSFFQDLDNNNELNTNFIGIPKEPVAFSNNAKGRMGPPSFEKAKVNFKKNGQQISIDLVEI